MALRNDKVEKNYFPFNNFREKLSDYIAKELNNTRDAVDIMKMMTEPNIKFERNNKPKEITE